jgi:hypothetical protein
MIFTNTQVKNFYAAAAKQYDAEFIDKSTSRGMKIIAGFLDIIGVMDKTDFMEHCTTTIGSGIYFPYTPGVATSQYPLDEQVSTLLHECQHIIQFDDDPVGFIISYLGDKSARAEFESAAYAADLEWCWKVNHRGYDIDRRAQSLLSYGLQQQHCDFMAQYLAVQDDVFRQGGAVSPVVACAWRWFQENPA